MNRDIKFKVWHTTEKRWVFNFTSNTDNKGICWINSPSSLLQALQYTGISDKTGKEMYEGDIVNFAVKKKICPHCTQKEMHSDLQYTISKYCPDCGNAVTNADFITTAKVEFNNGGFAYRYNENKEHYQSWPIYVAESQIA